MKDTKNNRVYDIINSVMGEDAPVLIDDVWEITKPAKPISVAAIIAVSKIDNWNINEIETITEEIAMAMAETHEKVNDHDVYFIDFGGYFGYSALVFRNGHHIYHANEYELHLRHMNMNRAEIHSYMKSQLNKKLYTNEQLIAPLTDYHDYKRRMYYIRNYYDMQFNYVSAFSIVSESKEAEEKKHMIKEKLYFSTISYSYVEHKSIIAAIQHLYDYVETRRIGKANDFDYWKSAFEYEFANYECIYGGDYMTAAYSATNGNSLNDVQKAAYSAAMEDYERHYEGE